MSVWMPLSLEAECGERGEQALRGLERARGIMVSQTRGLSESNGGDLATALAIAPPRCHPPADDDLE